MHEEVAHEESAIWKQCQTRNWGTGYLKAVWLDVGPLGPLGPEKAFRNVGDEAPHICEGFPGPPGPARPQKRAYMGIKFGNQFWKTYAEPELENQLGA
jgi:hypothetical protein